VSSTSSPAPETADMASLGLECGTGLKALQQIQHRYDDDMWDIDHPTHAKVRHVHIHLSTTVGRLASLIEPADHDACHGRESADNPADPGAVANLVADLLMHAAQLANCYDLELDSALARRYRNNAQRFAPTSAFAAFGADRDYAAGVKSSERDCP
jgi:hypothetical protein